MKVKLGTIIESIDAYQTLLSCNSFLSADTRFYLMDDTDKMNAALKRYSETSNSILKKYQSVKVVSDNDKKKNETSFRSEQELLLNAEVELSFEPFDEKLFLSPENKLTTAQMKILKWMTKKIDIEDKKENVE